MGFVHNTLFLLNSYLPPIPPECTEARSSTCAKVRLLTISENVVNTLRTKAKVEKGKYRRLEEECDALKAEATSAKPDALPPFQSSTLDDDKPQAAFTQPAKSQQAEMICHLKQQVNDLQEANHISTDQTTLADTLQRRVQALEAEVVQKDETIEQFLQQVGNGLGPSLNS